MLRLESINGGPTVEYRIRDEDVQRRAKLPDGRSYRDGGSAWTVLTRSELLALPSDGIVWEWLRAHGWTRPSPSGPTVPEAQRDGRRVRISRAAYDAAVVLAEREGCSVPEAIEQALDAATQHKCVAQGNASREDK